MEFDIDLNHLSFPTVCHILRCVSLLTFSASAGAETHALCRRAFPFIAINLPLFSPHFLALAIPLKIVIHFFLSPRRRVFQSFAIHERRTLERRAPALQTRRPKSEKVSKKSKMVAVKLHRASEVSSSAHVCEMDKSMDVTREAGHHAFRPTWEARLRPFQPGIECFVARGKSKLSKAFHRVSPVHTTDCVSHLLRRSKSAEHFLLPRATACPVKSREADFMAVSLGLPLDSFKLKAHNITLRAGCLIRLVSPSLAQ